MREHSGRNQAQMASELGWPATRLCRLETGTGGATGVQIASLLTACRVTGPEYERVLALSRDVYELSWLRSHDGYTLHDRRMLFHHERIAGAISEYEPLTIPALLQTEHYLRAALNLAGLVPEDTVNELVRAHLERLTIFLESGPPPRFAFFISEHVLRSPIGVPRTMNDQLTYLVIAASRPECSIRIVPGCLGPSGLLGGPFRLMEHPSYRAVVQTRSQTVTSFLQQPGAVAAYRAILARLDELAFDEAQSRQLLAELADGQDRAEADLP